jgi:hypothetical protein
MGNKYHAPFISKLDDVRVSARKGVLIIRSGKGDTYRNAEVREALRIWLNYYNFCVRFLAQKVT